MNLKTLMTLAIAAAFSAPVLAQQAPGKMDTPASNPQTISGNDGSKPADRPAAGATAGGFASLDRNNDGYLSRHEANDAQWNARFSELDKDNDGRLSQSEFDAMHSAAGATRDKDASSPSTTGGMGGSVGPAGTQSGSSTSGIGDKPGQKQ
jgi:hypothetical protein